MYVLLVTNDKLASYLKAATLIPIYLLSYLLFHYVNYPYITYLAALLGVKKRYQLCFRYIFYLKLCSNNNFSKLIFFTVVVGDKTESHSALTNTQLIHHTSVSPRQDGRVNNLINSHFNKFQITCVYCLFWGWVHYSYSFRSIIYEYLIILYQYITTFLNLCLINWNYGFQ